jgi:NADPH:quinone reductase-like Zn-dependent oxidoreductase
MKELINMRALAIDAYGGKPTLRDLPEPHPQSGEIRLRMRAAGVNPMDWRVRDGAAAQFGQSARFPMILGLEGAGVVDEVGDAVDTFKSGDAVFGLFWPQVFEYGTFADFLVVPADARMASKPESLTFEQAAVLPLAAGAAMVVQEWIDLQAGETILVVGATGGVGSYTVQLAKARGARVLATSSATDSAYIRSLGADEVIDFEQEDVAEAASGLAPGGVDALLDVVSPAARLARMSEVVRPGGRVASLINSADVEALAARQITAANILTHPAREHFEELGRLVEEGKLIVPIEHVLPLEDAVAALAMSEEGRTRGKIALAIS